MGLTARPVAVFANSSVYAILCLISFVSLRCFFPLPQLKLSPQFLRHLSSFTLTGKLPVFSPRPPSVHAFSGKTAQLLPLAWTPSLARKREGTFSFAVTAPGTFLFSLPLTKRALHNLDHNFACWFYVLCDEEDGVR